MLRLILDYNLTRFSASIRAFSVWFGLPLDVVDQKTAGKTLRQVLQYLNSPSDCEKALWGDNAQDVYYALWAMAFENIWTALPQAVALSHSSEVEKRFAAIHFLTQVRLKECLPQLLIALGDDDLRISSHTLMGLVQSKFDRELIFESNMFERLEQLLPRVKHKLNNLTPLVWNWLPITLDRELLAGQLVECLGTRSPKRMIPYLSMMNAPGRGRVARVLSESKQKDEETLKALLLLVGDLSSDVRERALKGLHGIELRDSDIERLEDLLGRQSQDLRRGIIQILLELPDEKLLASVQRLIRKKRANQHFAALELLKECKQNGRSPDLVKALASCYRQRATISSAEEILLNEISMGSVEKYSLDNALGLVDPEKRTLPTSIRSGIFSKVKLGSSATIASLRSLDALVEEHRNDVIEIKRGDKKIKELLGNTHMPWWWSQPIPQFDESSTNPDFPLANIWETWWQTRPKDCRDDDGFELIRGVAAASLFMSTMSHRSSRQNNPIKFQDYLDMRLDFELKYASIIRAILEWLVSAHPANGETDFILSALEESVGRIPETELIGLTEHPNNIKIRSLPRARLIYLDLARQHRARHPDTWLGQHHTRLWNIVSWLQEPKPSLPGDYVMLEDALFAYEAGAATRDDLLYLFLGPHQQGGFTSHFQLLSMFSVRKSNARTEAELKRFPIIQEIVDECRERILDVECRRGELPTSATPAAIRIYPFPQ